MAAVAAIKPGECKAFVGKGSIQKRWKAKQRQPLQILPWVLVCLSFVVSLFAMCFCYVELGAKNHINFYLCKKNII